jgi:hypothetical protein
MLINLALPHDTHLMLHNILQLFLYAQISERVMLKKRIWEKGIL